MPTGTKEIALIKAARQPVIQTQQFLEKNDVAGARKAWEKYDPIWNGMEVYISHRSRPNYEDLELNWQAKISKALEAPDAKPAEVVTMTKAMIATWEKALKVAEEGAAISPLFDDVASVREGRQPLRAGVAALAKSDVNGAKAAWGEFTRSAWPKVSRLFKERALDAFNDVEAAVAAARPAFVKLGSTVAELTPLLTAVNTKFGAGQTAMTQAARAAK